MKTVFVLVDALKSLYLTEENMPFLYGLSKRSYYIRNIIPCAGFCERSEIFTGLDGYDTGNFTAIGYMPENSPYKNDKQILRLFNTIEKISGRISSRLFPRWRIKKSRALNKYRIPYTSLANFALTEDGNRQFTEYRNLFEELDNANKTYSLNAFTSLADFAPRIKTSLYDFAKQEMDTGTYFIPLYIGIIDAMGHKYGADMEGLKPYLQDVDSQLKDLYEYAQKKGYAFAVMGDHGMVPVTKKVDIMSKIETCSYNRGKDYEVFYDSTMVRFWFFNKETEEGILSLLNDRFSKEGFIVDQSNYVKYRIPLDISSTTGKPVYGDIVWCANPGVLVSPDYFHSMKESENGMHGYIEVVEGHSTGLFVAHSTQLDTIEKEKGHSSEVCGLLSQILEVKAPKSSLWSRKIK